MPKYQLTIDFIYDDIQKLPNGKFLFQFTDLLTGSTFYVSPEEAVEANLTEMREIFRKAREASHNPK